MAKGDNKQGPSGNTRKGSKKGEDHCNQVDVSVNTTQGNTSGQASSSDQGRKLAISKCLNLDIVRKF